MKLKNYQIYNIGCNANKIFNDTTLHFPVKLGFYLFKNLNKMVELSKEIEAIRLNIIKKYPREITPEQKEELQKELNELSEIVQEVDLYYLNLAEFDDISLTTEQLKVIIDMIDDSNFDEDGFEEVYE